MSESILDRIQAEIATAMKSKDADRLSTLRMLKTALMEAKTRKAKDATLAPDEEIEILQHYVKKRREAIEAFTRAGRLDVVAKEEREIEVTKRFLPQPLSEDALRVIVNETVTRTGATTPRVMGKVIDAVMALVKGRAEGRLISKLVKEALGG